MGLEAVEKVATAILIHGIVPDVAEAAAAAKEDLLVVFKSQGKLDNIDSSTWYSSTFR